MSDDEKPKLGDEFIQQDLANAELVKDIPCQFCGRKSVARLRQYNENKMFFMGFCPDHIFKLKKLTEGIK